MKIQFWSVGKAHDAYVKSGVDAFTSRIAHYYPVEWVLIQPPRHAGALAENDLRRKEGESITARLSADDYLIALDERGKQVSSEGLAALLQLKAGNRVKQLVFLIGGAYGIDDLVLQRADFRWSLSQLVFPHQLVRLILAEQVYRACTINRNENTITPELVRPSDIPNLKIILMFSITNTIILITCLVSLAAFYNEKIKDDLLFWPAAINSQKQYYRFLSYGAVHADFMHLAFNMYALFVFGQYVEAYSFSQSYIFGQQAKLFFLILYVTAIVISTIPDYYINRTNYDYRALGASGAVSAVTFAGIMLNPNLPIGILFIPIPIPGYIFGFLFLGLSAYLAKRGGSNIGHGAHFTGAVYGLLYTIITTKVFTDYEAIKTFINTILGR